MQAVKVLIKIVLNVKQDFLYMIIVAYKIALLVIIHLQILNVLNVHRIADLVIMIMHALNVIVHIYYMMDIVNRVVQLDIIIILNLIDV